MLYVPDIQHQAWLSLGSNLGRREAVLDRALGLIGERLGEIVIRSGLYESDAWGFQSGNAFLNCCLELRTPLEPGDLLQGALEIEKELGRKRTVRGKTPGKDALGPYTDRVIDIDILLFGQRVFKDKGITIPHPRMNERLFVLMPLEEIAPGLRHPLSGMTIRELRELCTDRSPIRRL